MSAEALAKAEALAAISRRTVQKGRKQGRDWCGVGWRKRVLSAWVSYAPQIGSALAPEEPRAAATATPRIERPVAEPFAKPLSVRRIRETENVLRPVVPPHGHVRADKAKARGRIRG